MNMNLLTGRRDKDSYDSENASSGGKNGIPQGKGKFGENYTHGFVFEKNTPYRYGGLTLSYRGITTGVNSEWVRHVFQNQLAHDLFQDQRQFPMLSSNWKPVVQITNLENSKFTSWSQ